MANLWNWKAPCSSTLMNMFHAVVILLSHNDCFMCFRRALSVYTLPGKFLNPYFWLRSTAGYYSFNNHFGFEHFYPAFENTVMWCAYAGHVMCWVCRCLQLLVSGDRNAKGAIAFSSSLIFISSRCQKTWILWDVMQSRLAALSVRWDVAQWLGGTWIVV